MIEITQIGKEITGASTILLFSADDIANEFSTNEFSTSDLIGIRDGKEKWIS